MKILLLVALALAPGIAIAVYFFVKDKFEKEPLSAIFISFVLGCFSVVPAIALEWFFMSKFPIAPTNIAITAVKAFVIIAGAEELSKYLMLRFYSKSSNFNEPYDGIFYGVMVSLGFAAVENIMYVAQGGFAVGLLRMFTAVPAHAMFGAIMGYYFGLAWVDKNNKEKHMLRGLFAAILLHGAYDFFLLQENYPGLGFVSFMGLFLTWKLVRKAIITHNSISPNKLD